MGPAALVYGCTPCSRRKRRAGGLLPARLRYFSQRVRYVAARSEQLGEPLLILSGRFGFLAPDDPIPRYDQALTAPQVEALLPLAADQLRRLGARQVRFYGLPRRTPGWGPYYDLLEQACEAAGTALVIERLTSKFI